MQRPPANPIEAQCNPINPFYSISLRLTSKRRIARLPASSGNTSLTLALWATLALSARLSRFARHRIHRHQPPSIAMPAAPRPMTKDEDVVAMRKLTEVTRRRERGIPRRACEQPKERAIDCCCYSGTNRRVSVLSSGTGPVFYFRNVSHRFWRRGNYYCHTSE